MLIVQSTGIINNGIARVGVLLCVISDIIDGVCWVYIDCRRTSSRHGKTALAPSCAFYQTVCRTGTNGDRIRHASAHTGHLRNTRGSCVAGIERNHACRFGALASDLCKPPKGSRALMKDCLFRYYVMTILGIVAVGALCLNLVGAMIKSRSRASRPRHSLCPILCDRGFHRNIYLIFARLTFGQSARAVLFIRANCRSPLWVISGHDDRLARSPLYTLASGHWALASNCPISQFPISRTKTDG